ncbi:MAG: hypothetical protein ABSF63_02065 [Candidatus Bathyarchaeia archaeon]
MAASRLLRVIVALDALLMAYGHVTLALGLSFLFRPPGSRPPPPPPSSQVVFHPVFPFFAIGAYFLIATIIFILGGLFVASGRIFTLANVGLILLAIVDNLLLIDTRTMPNIFLGRIIHWSTGWFPLGTVQVLLGQSLLIVLCAILLKQSRK